MDDPAQQQQRQADDHEHGDHDAQGSLRALVALARAQTLDQPVLKRIKPNLQLLRVTLTWQKTKGCTFSRGLWSSTPKLRFIML